MRILADNRYHSPEHSEDEGESNTNEGGEQSNTNEGGEQSNTNEGEQSNTNEGEQSNTNEGEQSSARRVVNVYNPSWRSAEVRLVFFCKDSKNRTNL
jgi:hypothetical protein